MQNSETVLSRVCDEFKNSLDKNLDYTFTTSDFISKFGEILVKPLQTISFSYRYAMRNIEILEWSILVENFKKYIRFSNVNLLYITV